MNLEYWQKIRATFAVGLLIGIIGTIAVETTGSLGMSCWQGILRAFLSLTFVVTGFVTIGRACNNNRVVIAESIDHFFLGCACGISGAQLILPSLFS